MLKVNKPILYAQCQTYSADPNQISSIGPDLPWPRGYKTFFMLNSAEHEIFSANKSQITNNCKFFLA